MKAIASRVLFVLICVGFFESYIFSQEGRYELNWIDNGIQTYQNKKQVLKFEYLRFEGATFTGEYMIPEYSMSFALGEYRNEKYSVTDQVFEAVPDSLLRGIGSIPDLETYAPKANVYSARDRHFLDVNLSTLRYNPESGILERLVKFQINSIPQDMSKTNITKKNTKAAFNSLLADGYWYKIRVKKTGIYKLTYGELESMGFSNIQNVRVFGYGGRQLSYFNSESRPEDLAECPIYMNSGADGIFNAGDYILFYAEGPLTWKYDEDDAMFIQKYHDFSSYIYYFITTDHGAGQKIETVNNNSLSENITVSTYSDYACYERNLLNLIGSGRVWYTEEIFQDPVDTVFQFSNIVPSSEVKVVAKVAGRSTSNRSASLLINDDVVDTEFFTPVDISFKWRTFAYSEILSSTFNAGGEEIKTGIEYQKYNLSDQAFIDYITINTRCQLTVDKAPFFFRDIESVGADNVARYLVNQVDANSRVWDVTDINNVFGIAASQNGSSLEFKAPADTLREYVIADLAYEYPRPDFDQSIEGVGPIENQNLHSLNPYNYIIVAKDGFSEQANRIADYHRDNSGLSVVLVSPEKIYNEFSSGTPDASALRDFFRHQYNLSSGSDGLKYVLLFGDGSYNNHMNTEGNTNFILTYQSRNSLAPTNSYLTDDFYGLLDDHEGEAEGKLDIGIGRLPVRLIGGDDSEAEAVVDKIMHYYNSEMTDWRRTLCFMGDDQSDGGSYDGVVHMSQADDMATLIEEKFPGFETQKILLDAYPQITAATGPTYPDAKEELFDAFNKGVLLFNYFGHGSENGVTAEKVLLTSDAASMKNFDRLPLFFTATCEFSRFDDVSMEGNTIAAKTTAGETLILNPEGGAVASFTTTRVVYANANFNLAKEVMKYMFENDTLGNPFRLGDIFRMGKNDINGTNKLNFTLLGDPAMILKFPRFNVITDSINHMSVENQVDTIKAFSKVTISGHIATLDSTLMSDFNGVVYPRVYDKSVQVTTLCNDPRVNENGEDECKPYIYKEQKNLIYKGKTTVSDGRFTFEFVVPKDISYNLGNGKISYYAENGTIDARGEMKEIVIGGTDNDAELDYDGPEIALYMNDERFEDGGMTNRNPYIYARLYDENGINTTGVGIGHDITAILDWDDLKPFVLNEYYQSDIDDYQAGTVYYQLSELEAGEHSLSLKAWDVFNNSSEEDISFVVEYSDGLVVNEVINYPNPVLDGYTEFQYTHNYPGEDHEVTLEIFDLSGRLVSTLKRTMYESGFVSTPLIWESRLYGNLTTGVYPYRLRITTSGGTSYVNQKLIILR